MKKKYLSPNMTVVKLQQQNIICTSDVESVQSNVGLDLGGASSNNTGGIVRTRENTNVWDEEW